MFWNRFWAAAIWVTAILVLLGTIGAALLNNDPFSIDFLGKLASIAVAPLTLALVWLTKVLADETRSTRLQNSEPHVIVTLEPSRYVQFFNVVIENVGAGPAFDVRITFEPDITFKGRKGETSLSALSLMNAPTLKSKQKISSFVANFDAFAVRQSTACCKCKDTRGEGIRRLTA